MAAVAVYHFWFKPRRRAAAAAAFERHVRQIHASGRNRRGPCLLDAKPALVHHFAIGSFDLVQSDLERALPTASAQLMVESLTNSGVRTTFHLRRELVNFKKACLLVLQEVLRIERGMVRHTTFFYRERKRCGLEGHDCLACCEWRRERRRELQHCVAANSGAGGGAGGDRACGDANTSTANGGSDESDAAADGDAYLEVSARLHSVRGLRIALQDARGLIKQLCLVPRYVASDEQLPSALTDLLGAMGAGGAVTRAASDVAAFGGNGSGALARDLLSGVGDGDAKDDAASGKTTPPRFRVRSAVSRDALEAPLAKLPAGTPLHIVHFVRQVLFARGMPKAAIQAHGATVLAEALRSVQQQTADVRECIDAAWFAAAPAPASAAVDGPTSTCSSDGEAHARLAADDDSLVAELRRAMKLGRHRRTLAALHAANTHLLATLDNLCVPLLAATTAGSSSSSPAAAPTAAAPISFVAGDAARGSCALWAPDSFTPLIEFVREHAHAHDAFEQRMRTTMASEGWPPPAHTRRTRVNEGGVLPCRVCDRSFCRLWQERGVCWQCERALREAGKCPFGAPAVKPATKRRDGAKRAAAGKKPGADEAVAASTKPMSEKAAAGVAAAHPFCACQGLCAACDTSFASCDTCRLAQGDGEAVLAALETWRPTKLYLDFDLTLCTTKGGANPLRGTHTVDAELHAAAVAMGDGATYVLTRNRHAAEIVTFLEERGLPLAGVHTTPSGTSKWDFINETLGANETALFVDDAAGEVGDPRMVADARVHRVLFRRH